MEQEKKVILLAGPTASGKSKLAIKLAYYFNGEIINADSMQIYKEISILTSKPSIQETKITKHHLYGFNSVKKKFSTGHWLKMVVKKIEDQWKKGQIPVVVGGAGLYFKALTDGLVKIPNIPNKVRLEKGFPNLIIIPLNPPSLIKVFDPTPNTLILSKPFVCFKKIDKINDIFFLNGLLILFQIAAFFFNHFRLPLPRPLK